MLTLAQCLNSGELWHNGQIWPTTYFSTDMVLHWKSPDNGKDWMPKERCGQQIRARLPCSRGQQPGHGAWGGTSVLRRGQTDSLRGPFQPNVSDIRRWILRVWDGTPRFWCCFEGSKINANDPRFWDCLLCLRVISGFWVIPEGSEIGSMCPRLTPRSWDWP